ncbi:MAG: hypothetical protein ACREPX_06890 [Rhodanobacteraceae bacterium]
MIRVVLAAILGGALLFFWGFVAHMLLPFSKNAMQQLPNEPVVLSSLQASVPERGMYFFPGMDMSKQPTPEEQKAWEAKVASGPSGLLVYRPSGGTGFSARLLISEFASNLLAALVAATVLTGIRASYGARVMTVMAFGLVAWLSVSVSEWIWYGFTTPFLTAELVDQVGGWLLAGFGIAAVLKPKRSRGF